MDLNIDVYMPAAIFSVDSDICTVEPEKILPLYYRLNLVYPRLYQPLQCRNTLQNPLIRPFALDQTRMSKVDHLQGEGWTPSRSPGICSDPVVLVVIARCRAFVLVLCDIIVVFQ